MIRTRDPAYARPSLTDCDREPIHIIGRIQSVGALIAVTADWLIQRASVNAPRMLGLDAEIEIGTPLAGICTDEALASLRTLARATRDTGAVQRRFAIDLTGRGRLHDVTVYGVESSTVLEFERHDPSAERDVLGTVSSCVTLLRACQSRAELFRLVTQQVKQLSGFDRVMLYRFDEDGSGEVVAEQREPKMEPYLGLKYPATDIPQQARALFLVNTVRMNADVADPGQEIRPERGHDGRPLDLTQSALRAHSPIHVEYLRNMGVGASLTISLICDGDLYGLIACHHRTARCLPASARSMLEIYGQYVSAIIESLQSQESARTHAAIQEIQSKLAVSLSAEKSLSNSIELILGEMGKVIQFDGFAVWIDGRFHADGLTLREEEFLPLLRFLNTLPSREVYTTDCLAEVTDVALDHAERVCGMLALPISRRPRDYVVLFRAEAARMVVWAGKPQKVETTEGGSKRLTPRKSFEAWRELRKGRSRPWRDPERLLAEAIRMSLLEVILRLTDNAMRERDEAQQKRDLLIAELNHRARNMLALIENLVQQSGANAGSVAEFTEIVGGRLHALARAHDLITRQNWNPASLSELIAVEIEGFTDACRANVTVAGDELQITPQAATTVALVVHEMVTNAAKYGALSTPNGRLNLSIERQPDGSAVISWREEGGPPVRAPGRHGFGSTIIHEALEHELGGATDLSYRLSGVTADFTLPARHVVSRRGGIQPPSPAPDPAIEDRVVLPPCHVLIVEDVMILARGVAKMLSRLGAEKVSIACDVAEGIAIAETAKIDCAVLDFNLGSETCTPVAKLLQHRGIPFVIASGYDADPAFNAEFPDVPVITKPVRASIVAKHLSRQLRRSDPGTQESDAR